MKKFDKFPLKEPVSEFLKEINSPKDLKKLNLEQLNILADELREFLLYSVSQSGGHFGAGLGAIELTIALHSVLNLHDVTKKKRPRATSWRNYLLRFCT